MIEGCLLRKPRGMGYSSHGVGEPGQCFYRTVPPSVLFFIKSGLASSLPPSLHPFLSHRRPPYSRRRLHRQRRFRKHRPASLPPSLPPSLSLAVQWCTNSNGSGGRIRMGPTLTRSSRKKYSQRLRRTKKDNRRTGAQRWA